MINTIPAFSYQFESGVPEVFIPSIKAVWMKDGTILPSDSVRVFGNSPIKIIQLPVDLVQRIQKISTEKLRIHEQEALLLQEHGTTLNTKGGF